MTETAEIIERYHRAYEALNGERAYKIAYERGWYAFRQASGFPVFKKRRADVERMIATLEFRARA